MLVLREFRNCLNDLTDFVDVIEVFKASFYECGLSALTKLSPSIEDLGYAFITCSTLSSISDLLLDLLLLLCLLSGVFSLLLRDG